MSENKEQNHTLSRRNFLIRSGKIAAATLLGSTFLGAEQNNEPSVEVPASPPEEVYEYNIEGLDLSFKKMAMKPKLPYISEDGKYYDLAIKQHVRSDQCTPDSLLLGDGPAFEGGRDIVIDDNFVNSKVAQEIINKGNAKIENWVNSMRTNNKSVSETIEMPGGIVAESKTTEPPDVNFTPNPILKLRQFDIAIAETLQYDDELNTSDEKKAPSLAERLLAGSTNCQEFTLLTAVLLAGDPMQIPSEILDFSFRIPQDQIDKIIKQKEEEKGSKLTEEELTMWSNRNRAHVCNVVNINNTPVVLDSTGSPKGPVTLFEYFRSYFDNGIEITSPIEITSILAENSYQAFPWENSDWVQATTPLGIAAAGESANLQN